MKKKILLIDNELDVHRIAKISLEDFGYEVMVLTTGEEALDWLESNIPDLILLNSVLPNMQGEEVCKLLKSNDKLKHIPIILYNAKCDISEKAKQVHANDCMINPFNSQDLLFKIKKLIG